MHIMANNQPVAFVVRGLTGLLVLFALWGALAARDTLAAATPRCRLNSDCPVDQRCAYPSRTCVPQEPPPDGSCDPLVDRDSDGIRDSALAGRQTAWRSCQPRLDLGATSSAGEADLVGLLASGRDWAPTTVSGQGPAGQLPLRMRSRRWSRVRE